MNETVADRNEQLLDFFKALADANRLKIVGLLAQRPYSVEELAALLGVRPSTASHHLSYLTQVGLVSARPESYYNVYRLEPATLEEMARRLLSPAELPQFAADVDLDAYDRKVLKTYRLPDGRLKALPSQRKKVEAILRYVIRSFEPDVRYTERQVNEILGRFHDDTSSLRRELIDAHLLERTAEGKAYWLGRVDESPR
jgi:predicted transcriptional regulator